MSLYGYKKKGKPALWTTMIGGSKPRRLTVTAKAGKPVKWLRPVSKRRQAVTAEYRQRAREFVARAVARGETCPVVNAIAELRNGVRYGCRISNRLNEVHHTRGRAGALLLDERHWLAVSKAGHRWLHANVAEARKRGWICEQGKWNTKTKGTE